MDLMTYSEVAEIFRVDPRTIKRWVKDGHLPAPISVSHKVKLFDASDIFKFLRSKKVGNVRDTDH